MRGRCPTEFYIWGAVHVFTQAKAQFSVNCVLTFSLIRRHSLLFAVSLADPLSAVLLQTCSLRHDPFPWLALASAAKPGCHVIHNRGTRDNSPACHLPCHWIVRFYYWQICRKSLCEEERGLRSSANAEASAPLRWLPLFRWKLSRCLLKIWHRDARLVVSAN